MKTEDLVILIVEDDYVFGVKLKTWLETKVKNVFLTENYKQGLAIAGRVNPDIVFLDNMLPDNKNNLDSLMEYRKHLLPAASLISMSASYSIEQVAVGIQKGVDYMIDKKDFKKSYVFEVLDAVIEAKRKSESLWRVLDVFKSKEKTKNVRNIAILEDDELFSFHMNWILDQKSNNIVVNTFAKAANFYSYCESDMPDIVFLDYHLPDATGEDVLKLIKAKNPKSKVILISSQEDSEIGIKLKVLGADNYIVKNEKWKTNFNLLLNDLNI